MLLPTPTRHRKLCLPTGFSQTETFSAWRKREKIRLSSDGGFYLKKEKRKLIATFYSLNFARNYRHGSFHIGIRIKLRSMCLTTVNSNTCFSQILSPHNRCSFQRARILMRFNIQRFYLREVLPKKISWRESVYKLDVPFQPRLPTR